MKLQKLRRILVIIMIVTGSLLVIGSIADKVIATGLESAIGESMSDSPFPSLTPTLTRTTADAVRSLMRTGKLKASSSLLTMLGGESTAELLQLGIETVMEELKAEKPFTYFIIKCWAWFPVFRTLLVIVLLLSIAAFLLSRRPRFISALARKWPKFFGGLCESEAPVRPRFSDERPEPEPARPAPEPRRPAPEPVRPAPEVRTEGVRITRPVETASPGSSRAVSGKLRLAKVRTYDGNRENPHLKNGGDL